MPYIELLACPVCRSPFTQAGTMLKCSQAHTFDIAKEGYVNLSLKQFPGDTREMLIARRNFFERGHYRPLSDAINGLIYTHLNKIASASPMSINILDAGCGEGYYTARLQQYLTEHLCNVECIGLDISKEAVRMAAKRYKQAFFVVANLKERLVIADQALHVITNIFAPRNADEFACVLTPGGLLLVIIPGPEHLRQLRSNLHLLDIEEHKQQHVIDQFAHQFDLITSTSLAYNLHLSNEEIRQIVMMTPNYWHLSAETRRAMDNLEQIDTEVACTCLLLQRQKT
jgi:23S rRNA (guanine745-N1)-methyltransferase